MVNPGAGLIL